MMKLVSSSSSLHSMLSNHSGSGFPNNTTRSSPGEPGGGFEALVSKLFSCNVVLVLTDHAKQFVKSSFGTGATLANVLNQFASVTNLHLTIRDLNGRNAYGLNKLRFRFYDADQFRTRPTGSTLKKLHFDIIASMANTYLSDRGPEGEEEDDESGSSWDTPWYDMWKNVFLDTMEPSDHDFIGAATGCFFVITKLELPHYKVIFERLCASVKQNSSLRFIQSDFVRYFIVLSDQMLEPPGPNESPDEFTRTCQSMKLDFPNSFVFYIEPNANSTTAGDDSTLRMVDELSSELNHSLNLNNNNNFQAQPTSLESDPESRSGVVDPLTASVVFESQENSRFYNELVSQRSQQNHQMHQSSRRESTSSHASSTTASTGQSRDLINDWLSHLANLDHVKEGLVSVSETIDFMLREFISKFLIPWAEKQIKFLGELIAQRKGFRKSIFTATRSLLGSMSSSTASLTKSLTGSGPTPSGVIYIPDAQEMQQRKLADICMVFGLHEMAHQLYYEARKDFESESAWLYYAGTSEMSAISAYLSPGRQYQHKHFEQAIVKYQEQCRSITLATRATILATELLCQLSRYQEAASLFIRMTGDDSDLRSAMFLEQASRCYLSVSPRIPRSLSLSLVEPNEQLGTFRSRLRKAAFYYILAGYRYNRCGLRHFALSCYRRFNYPNWDSASDHVNLTVAKLFLSIAASNRKYSDYYRKGLHIYRNFSHKQVFFAELFRELKKTDPMVDLSTETRLYELEVPFVFECHFESFDSIVLSESRKNVQHTCYVGEQICLRFVVQCPFELTISNCILLCDRPEVNVIPEAMSVAFVANEPKEILLRFTAQAEVDFSLVGFQYEIDGVVFRNYFTPKIAHNLVFRSVVGLPLVSFGIEIFELGLRTESHANPTIQVFGSEMLTIRIGLTPKSDPQWRPGAIHVHTTARDHFGWHEILPRVEPKPRLYPLEHFGSTLTLPVQIPSSTDRYSIDFRLVYQDQGKARTVSRKLVFEVTPCLEVAPLVESVITVSNLHQSESLAVYDVTVTGDPTETYQSCVLVPAGLAAHVLQVRPGVRWIISRGGLFSDQTNRHGVIHL